MPLRTLANVMAYFFVGIGVSLTALFLWMGAKSASSKGLERYFWAGVTLKVLAGLILGWLYKSIYSGGDPWAYFEQSNHLTKLFFTDFSAYQEAFFRPSFNSLYGQSRQDYVVRWFSLIHLFGGSSFWLTSIYLSLLSFSGIWVLVCALIRQFPKAKKAVLWSFLFLPTMIFWSSSWTKESVLWCFLGWMVAILVSPKEKWRFWHLPLLLIAFFLIWKVKYYYLAALLPALLSWRIAKFFTTRLQVSAQLTIYGLILAGATQLHYNLQLNHLIKAIFDSHHYILENTSPQNIVLELPLEPSLWELVRNIPKALWGSFVAPFPPHSPLQVLVTLENIVVLIVWIGGIWLNRHNMKKLISSEVLALLLYIIVLAVILPLASPNIGALVRYKVGFWSFWVLLGGALWLVPRQKNDSPIE